MWTSTTASSRNATGLPSRRPDAKNCSCRDRMAPDLESRGGQIERAKFAAPSDAFGQIAHAQCLGEFDSWNGFAEIIPLHHVALMQTEERQLLRSFHAFGNGLEIELFCPFFYWRGGLCLFFVYFFFFFFFF